MLHEISKQSANQARITSQNEIVAISNLRDESQQKKICSFFHLPNCFLLMFFFQQKKQKKKIASARSSVSSNCLRDALNNPQHCK